MITLFYTKAILVRIQKNTTTDIFDSKKEIIGVTIKECIIIMNMIGFNEIFTKTFINKVINGVIIDLNYLRNIMYVIRLSGPELFVCDM